MESDREQLSVERDAREAAPVKATRQTCPTEELVRRTITETGAAGLPERSQRRIRRGLEKLRAGSAGLTGGGTKVHSDTPAGKRGTGLATGILGVAAMILFLPLWVVPVVMVVVAILSMVFVAVVGFERIGKWILAWYERLREKDADRAEVLRRRAARASAMLTAIAARLPERWVQGLYLPDFEPADELPEKMRSEPFERLSV